MAAAQQKKKKESGGRQAGRPNGKAWKQGKTPAERLEEELARNDRRAARHSAERFMLVAKERGARERRRIHGKWNLPPGHRQSRPKPDTFTVPDGMTVTNDKGEILTKA